MTFSGRVAKFFGKIRAVMNDGETHDMELTCAGMEIQFAEDVVIRKTDSSQNLEVVPEESKNGKEKRPGIQEIRCESLVKVRIDQLVDSQLDAQHEAEFSDWWSTLKQVTLPPMVRAGFDRRSQIVEIV